VPKGKKEKISGKTPCLAGPVLSPTQPPIHLERESVPGVKLLEREAHY